MSCVVAIEGFRLSHQFVVKEMTILFEGEDFQHFHFNCPADLIIPPRDWNTIRYMQKLNGLDLIDDSYVPYEVVGYILSRICHLKIFTAGHYAMQFLTSKLPSTNVVDMCQAYNFKYPLTLEDSHCFIKHPSRYCTLSKAKTLRTALQIYFVND